MRIPIGSLAAKAARWLARTLWPHIQDEIVRELEEQAKKNVGGIFVTGRAGTPSYRVLAEWGPDGQPVPSPTPDGR